MVRFSSMFSQLLKLFRRTEFGPGIIGWRSYLPISVD